MARMKRQRRATRRPKWRCAGSSTAEGSVPTTCPSCERAAPRHRVHRAPVIVEVKGCFWHGCPEHGTRPKANAEWSAEKLEANRRRDEDSARRLTSSGWTLRAVWEHEDPQGAADRIESLLERKRSKATH